jgi:hypothetical protein
MAEAETKVYVGDIGTVILADMKADISAATLVNLRVVKPGASSEVIWDGELFVETLQEYVDDTDATLADDDFDGVDPGDDITRRIKYTVVALDWSVAKKYKMQGYAELPAWQGRGETFEITITALQK